MSIYRPISSTANVLTSVGSGILSGVTNTLGSKAMGLIPSNSAFGKIGQAAVGGLVNRASTELNRRVNSKVNQLANSAERRLNNILNKGLNTFGLGLFGNTKFDKQALLDSGGLSLRDIYTIWKETDPDTLSRQNFYVIEVNDRSGASPVAKDGSKFSRFNLLCTDLSFNSFEIQDDAVNIGSSVMNKLASSQRTEMTLTLYDDMAGSIKKWAEEKSLAMAQSNGLFMPPVNYVFDVKVVFGTNIDNEDYYNQVYTMQIASMQHQLSRDAVEIEKVQLQFVQFDTFMPSWGG